MFLLAALAIPVFYIAGPASTAPRTNYTVVDTWRFWIIHLWVEGFFEFFATTVVALTFYQLGLTRRNVALRVIYLDAILYFLGGVIGTGHHWYFTGHSNVNMALSAMFSVLEVVPLTLLTLDAWDFVRTTRGECDVCGKAIAIPHKWTFYFLMAVGFWNFVGAGMFGLPGQPADRQLFRGRHRAHAQRTAHAALMGVFGMLAIALMVFVLRQTSTDARWPGIEKYVKVAFWGTNGGLAMMVFMSLFPGGVLQLWDVVAARLLARPQPRLHPQRARAPVRVAAPARRPGVHPFRRRAAADRVDQGLSRHARHCRRGVNHPDLISPRARVSRSCGTSLRSSPCHRNARRSRILRITLTR